MQSLVGKWALVTGSSRGIGQQIAMGLAQHRCNIIVHGRKPENLEETLELLREYKVEKITIAGDLSTDEGVDTVIKEVTGGIGHVDILYNNAAVMNNWKPVWDISREEWKATFPVNLFAMVTLCRALAPEMRVRGYGRIVNLTSGIEGIPQLAPYSVSKAAVDKYTQDLAAGLQGSNVLVNCLDPGWLKTDMGGPDADYSVTTVLPGALVPALLEDHGPTGKRYAAQDYRDPK